MSSTSKGTRGGPQFSDLDTPDVAGNASEAVRFTEAVGTRRVGTTAERNALVSPELFTGLLWGDNTLGYDLRYTGSAWKRVGVSGVQFVGNTDANGIIKVTHNFGSVPVWAQVTLQNGASETLALILDPIIWDSAATWATQISVRYRRNDTNGWATTQPVQGFLTVGN